MRAGLLRLSRRRRPDGTSSAPSTTGPTERCGSAFNAWSSTRARRRCPTSSSSTSRDVEPLGLPGDRRLHRARPLGPSWHRLDSAVRETEELRDARGVAWRRGRARLLLARVAGLGRRDLMRRLIDGARPTPRTVTSCHGPAARRDRARRQHVGRRFVPQTKIIPQGDLVITHGGNNTTTESLHFGKPMICCHCSGTSTTTRNACRSSARRPPVHLRLHRRAAHGGAGAGCLATPYSASDAWPPPASGYGRGTA